MKRPRILVVEDQAIVARDIASRLTRLGYEPAGRTDRAEEAITMAVELRPDLIMMDVSLAGEMDGIAAARHIRRHHPVPVVFLTAHTDDTTMRNAMETEPFGYIIKPFQDRELRSAIELGIHRGRMEQAMRASEQRFRLLFENSIDAVIVTAPEDGIRAANGAACRMFGRSEQELRGLGLKTIIDARDPKFLAAQEECAASGCFRGELSLLRADGSAFPAEVSCASYRGENDDERISMIVRDITSRREAEEALRRANERLELAQTAAAVGVWDWNIETGRMEWASELFRLFGLDPTQGAAGFEAWRAVVHPEDLAAAEDQVTQAVRDGSMLDSEYRVMGPDGQVRWINSIGRTFCDAAGKPVRMLGVCIDISARKRPEEALRRTEERYRRLFDTSPDALFLVGPDGRFLDANGVAVRRYGYSIDELKTMTPVDLADDSLRAKAAVRVAEGLQESMTFEWRHRTKHGRVFPVEISTQPVLVDGKRCTFADARDITERKRAEATLRMQAAALEATGGSVVICDKYAVVQWVNPAFAAITGYSVDELRGHEIWGYLAPEMPVDVAQSARSAAAEGAPWRGELIVRVKQGQPRTFDAAIAAVRDEGGAVTYLIGVGQDVTEQRRLESQLLRAQRLESVGRLASGLAHDLNNVLLPVLLAPAYLRTVVSDRSALEVLDTIETSVKRGADIIKQLLTFGRGSDARRGPVCLCRIVSDAMRVLGETLPRSIDVRCELPPGTRMVSANSTQLHQVIMNLCLNARDAMAGFGRLTLRVEEMTLSATEAAAIPDASPGRFHVLSVIDTGCGIPPELTGQIFEPFFTTKEVGEASGLGLSTALGIVRGHKGFIEVRSEVGKGTEMRVYLPELPSA
jgi:PAS domain S-box-containing protein